MAEASTRDLTGHKPQPGLDAGIGAAGIDAQMVLLITGPPPGDVPLGRTVPARFG